MIALRLFDRLTGERRLRWSPERSPVPRHSRGRAIAVVVALAASLLANSSTPALGQEGGSEVPAGEQSVSVEIIPSHDLLRPGEQFTATVKLSNDGPDALDGLTLGLSLSAAAVDLNTATSTTQATGPTISAGKVSWPEIGLLPLEEIVVTATGTVTASVVSLNEVPIEVSVSQGGIVVANNDALVRPLLMVSRIAPESTPASTGQGEVVVMKMTITPNGPLTDLIVTETLAHRDGSESVVPVATRRADEARASAGRIEWPIGSVEPGGQINLEYLATYPASLNIGTVSATAESRVRDAVSELFRAEDDLELNTPLLEMTSFELAGQTPGDPINPGDTVRASIVVQNSGVTAEDVTVEVTLGGTALVISNESPRGQTTDAGVAWSGLEIPATDPGAGGTVLSFDIQVSNTVREDTAVEQTATLVVQGKKIDQQSAGFPIETGRREGSDTRLWFTLILLFMLLAFGGLLFVVTRVNRDAFSKRAATFAVVTAIIAAILILAFGLDVETETTLTLLGTIAGYVLGQRLFEEDAKPPTGGQDGQGSDGPSTDDTSADGEPPTGDLVVAGGSREPSEPENG